MRLSGDNEVQNDDYNFVTVLYTFCFDVHTQRIVELFNTNISKIISGHNRKKITVRLNTKQ